MIESSLQKKALLIWEKLLTNPLPLVGHWGQQFALNMLSQFAQQGDARAVQALVGGLSTSKASTLHPVITEFLSAPLPASSQDALWEGWVVHRLPVVEEILVRKNKQASYHSPAWAISLAKLGKNDSLEAFKPEHLAELVDLRANSDPMVAATASTALKNLNRQATIDELYRLWSITRADELWQLAINSGYTPQNPVEVRALFLLKVPKAQEIGSLQPRNGTQLDPYRYMTPIQTSQLKHAAVFPCCKERHRSTWSASSGSKLAPLNCWKSSAKGKWSPLVRLNCG